MFMLIMRRVTRRSISGRRNSRVRSTPSDMSVVLHWQVNSVDRGVSVGVNGRLRYRYSGRRKPSHLAFTFWVRLQGYNMFHVAFPLLIDLISSLLQSV